MGVYASPLSPGSRSVVGRSRSRITRFSRRVRVPVPKVRQRPAASEEDNRVGDPEQKGEGHAAARGPGPPEDALVEEQDGDLGQGHAGRVDLAEDPGNLEHGGDVGGGEGPDVSAPAVGHDGETAGAVSECEDLYGTCVGRTC